MEMIGHQAVTIEPEWIPQLGLAQRLQESAVIIIIVEDALPIITTIKNVKTEIMCDHPRPVAQAGTFQNLRWFGNKINCSDTGFLPPASPQRSRKEKAARSTWAVSGCWKLPTGTRRWRGRARPSSRASRRSRCAVSLTTGYKLFRFLSAFFAAWY